MAVNKPDKGQLNWDIQLNDALDYLDGRIDAVQATTGPQGTQGTQGLQGAVGAQGAVGTQGSSGTQGAIGAQGSAGYVGADGTQGAQGLQGTDGSSANTADFTFTEGTITAANSALITAPNGDLVFNADGDVYLRAASAGNGIVTDGYLELIIGDTNVINTGTGHSITDAINNISLTPGPQGTQGVSGSQGVQGANGTQGSTGPQGTNGSNGSQGTQGTQGTNGAQGANGSNGSQGIQGLQGTTGSQGANGSNGSQGTQGLQGATGSQGVQGTTGSTGTQGTTGSQGANGSNGSQGAQGTQGLQGATGSQGAGGTQGSTGAQGTQGTQGLQGPLPAAAAMNYATTVGTKVNVPNGSTYPYTVASVTITTTGNPVLITATGDAENQSSASWNRMQLFRGTTAIGNDIQCESSAASENSPYALHAVDSPSAGTYTYNLKVLTQSGGGFNYGENTGPVLTAIELTGKTGTQGTTGAQGTTGTQGTTGAQGTQGTQGLQGSTGTQGASGFVNAGVDVTLGNLKARMSTSGNRHLQVSTVTGTYTVYGSGVYSQNGVSGSTIDAGAPKTITTTPTGLNTGYNFATGGATDTWVIMDTGSALAWRITLVVGSGYNNNFISIERL